MSLKMDMRYTGREFRLDIPDRNKWCYKEREDEIVKVCLMEQTFLFYLDSQRRTRKLEPVYGPLTQSSEHFSQFVKSYFFV